jgi:hypothetical protein
MNSKVQLVSLKIADIQTLDKNPRTISPDELQKLIQDIQGDPNFLLQRPPLINRVGGINYCYAGTQRLRAAKAIGQKDIYCFVEEDVPEHIQDERMIKDNLHRGQWDEEKLLALHIDLEIMNDFGFKDFEVNIFANPVPEQPNDLTAPHKDAPPTMKITFSDTRQMDYFEARLKGLVDNDSRLTSISYSVSQGEI